MLQFTARILIRGVNPYVLVSARRAAALKPGWRAPMPVRVRVNGRPDDPWRINMMPVGDGSFYLFLHGDLRKASQTAVGQSARIELGFDDEYRGGPSGPMLEWFGQALRKNAAAMRGWVALTPSRQKEILRYFARLKTEAARQRHVKRALTALSDPVKGFGSE